MCLLVLSLPLVVSPVHFDLYVVHKSLALGALTTLAVGLVLLEIVRGRKAGSVFPLALPLLLYLGSGALSLTQAVNLAEGISQLLLRATGITLFWVVLNSAGTPATAGRVLALAALSGVIVSLVGISQLRWGEIPGLEEILRPASTFGNKALAAQFVVLVLPLPFLFLFFHEDFRRQLFWGFCSGIVLTYFIHARSRGAWIASLMALLVIALWLRIASLKRGAREERPDFFALTRRKVLILFGVAVFVAGMALERGPAGGGQESLAREVRSIVQPREYTTGMDRYRLAWWQNTLFMIRDHPLLGVGLGNWQFMYLPYARSAVVDPTVSLDSPPYNAHNDYLQILAETGPVGLLAFIWVLLSLARRAWQGFLATPDRFSNLAIAALSLGLLAQLGHAFVDFPFEQPVPTAFFWIFSGLLWSLSSARTAEPKGSPLKRLVLWAGLGLLVALYTGVNLAKVRADYRFALATGYNWAPKSDRPHSLKEIRADLKEVQAAIALYPFDYQYHLAEGILHLRLRNYPQAAPANQRALRLHPHDMSAYLNLGLAYMGLGEAEKAEATLKRALRIWPDSVGAHNNLGILYAALGRREEARREFLTALRINPGDDIAWHNLRRLAAEESGADEQ